MPSTLKLSLVSLLLLLAACRSDPVQYHTLLPAQPGSAQRSAGSDLQIEKVTVPPQVDRQQIVIRLGSSGLAILETQWWGASLADELKNALADQLYGANARRKTSLRVDVQRFDSVPGQYALVDANWRLRTVDTQNRDAIMTCRTVVQTPAGPTIDELVAAQQTNIKRLAMAISQVLGGTRSDCPGAP